MFLTVMFTTAGVSTHNTGKTALLHIKHVITVGENKEDVCPVHIWFMVYGM